MNKDINKKIVEYMRVDKKDKEILETYARAYGKDSLHYEAIDAYLKSGSMK